jgi:hypothetical protein
VEKCWIDSIEWAANKIGGADNPLVAAYSEAALPRPKLVKYDIAWSYDQVLSHVLAEPI